jgi:hypothetical protein
MNILSTLHAFFYSYTYFLTWRAIVEILFFSTLFYQVSLWLKKDRHLNLLGYWYGYCTVGLIAHALQLNTISSVLFLFAPTIIMLFLMMHQEQLQKNFVALRSLTPARTPAADWLEQLIRSCLVAVNNNKTLVCVVERSDSLQDFLTTSCILNAELHNSTFDTLITSNIFNDKKLVWLNDHGMLRALNASWDLGFEGDAWQAASDLPAWQQDALFFTRKTDAIVIGIISSNRTFTIIARGQRYENIAAHNALKFLKKIISHPELGAIHEDSQQNTHNQQPHA